MEESSFPMVFIVERSCVSKFRPDPNDKAYHKKELYQEEKDAYGKAIEFMIRGFVESFRDSTEERALTDMLMNVQNRTDMPLRNRCQELQKAIKLAGPAFGTHELSLYTVRKIKLVHDDKPRHIQENSMIAFALTTLVATKEETENSGKIPRKKKKKTIGFFNPLAGSVSAGESTSRSRSTKNEVKAKNVVF